MKDRITVVGNIASVPERRTFTSGEIAVNFRLAANQSYYDRREGKWVDGEPNFYSVSAYRVLAEHALESLFLGERVIVTGSFRVRRWDTGEKKGVSAEIDADALGHDLRWGTTQFRRAHTAPDNGAGRPDGDAEGAAQWNAASVGSAVRGDSSPVAGDADGAQHEAATWASVPAEQIATA